MNQTNFESDIMEQTPEQKIDAERKHIESVLHYMDEFPYSGQNREGAAIIRKFLSAAPLVAVSDDLHDRIMNLPCADIESTNYKEGHRDARHAAVELVAGQVAPQATVLPEEIIAGALFDFMGFLTTRDQVITLSSHHEAGPAVEALRAFADKRQFNLDEAKVADWRSLVCATPITPQATVEPLTDEQILAIYDRFGKRIEYDQHIINFARALLAATPPTSKATEQASLVGELEEFLTEHEITGWREDMFAGLRKIMFSYDQTFDELATSKADTGKPDIEQQIGTYRDGWNNAVLELHTRCLSWAEARQAKRGGNALNNFAEEIYKQYTPLKSATPPVPAKTMIDPEPAYKALAEAKLALCAVNSGASAHAIGLIDGVLNATPSTTGEQ